MNFLVDARLPRRIAHELRQAGHDVLHTLDLPAANRTSDTEIVAPATREDRVEVTKDADFVNGFVLNRQPARLLLVSTGNISNADHERLVISNLRAITDALATHHFVELSRSALIVRA